VKLVCTHVLKFPTQATSCCFTCSRPTYEISYSDTILCIRVSAYSREAGLVRLIRSYEHFFRCDRRPISRRKCPYPFYVFNLCHLFAALSPKKCLKIFFETDLKFPCDGGSPQTCRSLRCLKLRQVSDDFERLARLTFFYIYVHFKATSTNIAVFPTGIGESVPRICATGYT
jgi:hypothetical protein